MWLGSVAGAQEDAPSARGELGEIVGTRTQGNDEAVAVQERIDTVSDRTSELLAKYRTALKQIEALDLYNVQMRDMITAQERERIVLEDQVERVQEVSRSVTPLMLRMIVAIEKFVDLDVPFLIDERTKRVEGLHRLMGRADVTTSEKFRQIMEAYQTENEYGRTIEAYRASLKVGGRENTVDFLRFGRIALVYLSLDETESGVWSQESRSWVPVDPGMRSSIRDGLRIARRQSAPDLIKLPMPAATEARGSS
jgi:hypothetical protein